MVNVIQEILKLDIGEDKKLDLIRVLLKETPRQVQHQTHNMLPPEFQDPTSPSANGTTSISFGGIRKAQ